MAEETVVEQVTFEGGYEELKAIVARLDAEDVSVHEMCELFARGKGLEQSLRGYLTTQQGKLDEIEKGDDLPRFTIVAPSDASTRAPAARSDVPVDTADFAPTADLGGAFAPPPASPPSQAPADDDIPF